MAVSILDSWSATVDAEPSGNATISAGSNRCYILTFQSEVAGSSLTVTVTVGGVSPTQSYELYVEDPDTSDDMVSYSYLWNESDITSMSGTAISWSDSEILGKRGWAEATYQDVDQTTFPKNYDTVSSDTNASPYDVPTPSSSGDRIIAVGMNKRNRTHDNWDTLTEVYDLALNTNLARMGGGEGDGGDATTSVTLSNTSEGAYQGIVLGAIGGVAPIYNLYYME